MAKKLLVALALGASLIILPNAVSAGPLAGPTGIGSAGSVGVDLVQYYGYGYRHYNYDDDDDYYRPHRYYHRYYHHDYDDDDSYHYRRY